MNISATTPPDNGALRRFVSKWNGIVDVMITLGAWTRTIVGDNLVQFGFGLQLTEVPLTEYAGRAADNFDRKPQHFGEMCDYLGIGGNH